MSGYDDLTHRGNSPEYHTGKRCVEKGCGELAGTAWSPYWCVKHNIERINRISSSLSKITEDFKSRKDEYERGVD